MAKFRDMGLSSAEYCFRVARRMSLTTHLAEAFCLKGVGSGHATETLNRPEGA